MRMINKSLFMMLFYFIFYLGIVHNLTFAQSQDRIDELIEKLKYKDRNIRKDAVDELAKLNWEPLKGSCITEKCHIEMYVKIKSAKVIHKPVVEDKCGDCHNTHGSKGKYYLIKENAELCFSCHESMKKIIDEKEYKHGPVKQGNCVACHDPHGSQYTKILRNAFPNTFYTSFEKGKYDLCFGCHKSSIPGFNFFMGANSDFRNGNWNLHYVHVCRKKGLSCKTCHEMHASNQEKHLKVKVPFREKGTTSIVFTKTSSGGKCITGCHKTWGYDRKNRVLKDEWY